jgi:hypothetical protein
MSNNSCPRNRPIFLNNSEAIERYRRISAKTEAFIGNSKGLNISSTLQAFLRAIFSLSEQALLSCLSPLREEPSNVILDMIHYAYLCFVVYAATILCNMFFFFSQQTCSRTIGFLTSLADFAANGWSQNCFRNFAARPCILGGKIRYF